MAISINKDKIIPWYFVMFFVIIAIIDAGLVYLAVSGNNGVTTENAYQKGLEYNRLIAQAEQQEVSGYSAEIDFNKEILVFKLDDANNQPISGAEVVAYFVRPTSSGYDFHVELPENIDGEYSTRVNPPLLGVWDVRVVVIWNKQQLQKTKRIVVE